LGKYRLAVAAAMVVVVVQVLVPVIFRYFLI
jgi:hypothetical protein